MRIQHNATLQYLWHAWPLGFLSCLIYWPIFPPLDCVSYQWLDICYIWIIAGRGSNVILMTDIHQSINVGCQSHAESGIKKSEPGKHISISLPSRVSLDPGSAHQEWQMADFLKLWLPIWMTDTQEWKMDVSQRDLRWPEVESNNDLQISFQSPTFPAAKAWSIKTSLLTITFWSLINFAIKRM